MTVRLRIVGVNDVYSLAALPRLRSLVEHAQRVAPADRLLVTVAGDFLAPSLLSSLDGGRGMRAAFDALGATHVTLGNHEDDLPFADLVARLSELSATVVVSNATGLAVRHTRADVVDVAGTRVGVLGLVEAEATFFRKPPFGGAKFASTIETARTEAAALRGAGCAAVIALTHQRLPVDRALAAARVVDFVHGGHEHEGYLELEHGTPLAKAPMNAASAVLADLVLGPGEPPKIDVRLEPVSAYPEHAAMRALVDRLLAPVVELEARTLFHIPPGETLSSAGSRHRETSLGTLVCSRLRDALEADAAIYNGGGLRGATEHVGAFSYADLRDELPFDNEVVVASLPGAVLRDAIRYSREKLTQTGGFLHVDDRARVSAAHELLRVAGAPLDPARLYRVALVRDLLLGMDAVAPLLEHARAHPEIVPTKLSGQEVKVALLRTLSARS